MSRTDARRRRIVAGDRSYVRVVMLRDGEELARWWLLVRPHDELAAADTLAKVFLAARRRGGSVALEGSLEPALRQVLGLIGMAVALRDERLVLEVRREAEDRKEIGVDEVVVADDPVP
jgi:hypothetical protein